MSAEMIEFLAAWQNYMYMMAPTFIIIGVLIYTFLRIKVKSSPSPKEKYDFICKYEIRLLLATHISIAIGIFLICNSYSPESVL